MSDIQIKTLEDIPCEQLTDSWNKAFSDYAANLNFTVDEFLSFMRQNGVRFEASIGAFDGASLVGLWMNGVRTVGGRLCAYDSGTAIWPEYRSLGISKMLAQKSSEVLRALGVMEYILEVMRDNVRAFEVYKKDGFAVSRKFTCLKCSNPSLGDAKPPSGVTIEEGPLMDKAHALLPLMEYVPSWQNSTESLTAIADRMRVVTAMSGKETVGFGIMQIDRGRIPQIGFAKEYWQGDIPGAVLKRLCDRIPQGHEVAVINIDDRAEKTLAFYRKHGFADLVLQYEMKKEL